MLATELPGRVVHVKMGSDAFSLMFEHVPWVIHMNQASAALDAFDNNDWQFFTRHFWSEHQHLKTRSVTLTELATFLDPKKLYAPNTLIDLATHQGLYSDGDAERIQCDLQRLLVMPKLCHWPPGGLGLIQVRNRTPLPGWPGNMWAAAILNQKTEQMGSADSQRNAAHDLAPITACGAIVPRKP